MADRQKFELKIYCRGVVRTLPVRGRKGYILVKCFLDELVGRRYAPAVLPRPVPDPGQDFYILDDEQDAAFRTFIRKLRSEERKA